MSTPHRATEEQWEIVEICREEGHTPWPTATCLLELRSRVEVLERRCEVQLQQLSDLQDCHHRLAGSVRLLEREVVTDQPEPAPAALAENVSVLDAKAWAYIGRQAILGDPDAQSLVDLLSDAPAAQPEPPTFQESQASKAHYEAESARLKCEAMQQPAKPAPDAPSVKDSLTDAPAGSLMERLAWIIEPGDPLVWSGTCGLILLEVAAWLRENDSEREMGGDAAATADLIEQEDSR
jgi:hypothetical protein